MGVSTDAILFYGIPLEEDTPASLNGNIASVSDDRYEINEDWEHLKRPSEPKSANLQDAEWDAWREQLRAYEKSIQTLKLIFIVLWTIPCITCMGGSLSPIVAM